MKAIATEENIRIAYKKLKADGIEPTVESIRKFINGGSNSTIYKILRMIEDENADTVICSNDPDEDALIREHALSLVQGIYQKCKKRAEELAIAQYRSLASSNAELAHKLKRLDEIEEQAVCKITAAEAKRTAAEAEKTAAEAKREESVAKVNVIEAKLQSVEKELKQRNAEIIDLKQQIKELKQAYEQQQQTNKMLQEILAQVQSKKTRSTTRKLNNKQSQKEL